MARVELDSEQYRRLISLLATQSALGTTLKREALLDESGLESLKPRLALDTDARTFANQLVRVAQDRGTLLETGKPALVNLLHWLRKELGGHEPEATFLDGLLAPHAAVPPLSLQAAPSQNPSGVPSSTVRTLLLAAFSDSELTTFCFDYFREVYDDFAGGMSRGDKVQRLVEWCDHRGKSARLLQLVARANPYQYGRIIKDG